MPYLEPWDPDFDAVHAASESEVSGFGVGDIWETATKKAKKSKKGSA